MKRVLSFARNFLREEEGAAAIEYGLIAALVAVALILGATALGTNLNTLFSNVGGKVGGVTVP